MGKINVLQPNVFNMLAAGEVVECPASVVKELVENSLDAGATEIDITVENGGIRKIQVSDNGIGILKEDMRTAFIPHATSKISEIGDLDSLSTLGFRGEALASIASVSEVTLISASKAQGTASKITLSGGKVMSECADSRSSGTIITVENLFFNTPARLKFLKKPSSEMRLITDTVRTLILSNPQVSFTLCDENGEVLRHEAGSLFDAVCAVYGVKTTDNLLEINVESNGTIRVGGFVSSCNYTKPNRSYQTVIINGRAVTDVTVQTAVERAYGDYLMKRAYPMFVIDIVMPFDEVDVNVHPRKSEVRFYDKQKVFGAVYHAVKDTVNASLGISALGFDVIKSGDKSETASVDDSSKATIDKVYKSTISNNAENADKTISVLSDIEIKNETEIKSENNEREDSKRTEQTKIDTSALYSVSTSPNIFPYSSGKVTGFKESNALLTPFLQDDKHDNHKLDYAKTDIFESEAQAENTLNGAEVIADEQSNVFDGKILGQIFATYLLVERDEKLYIIDQHATHERILYDKIVEKCKPEYSQPLLIPYKLFLTGSEEEYIERIMPTLKSLGFEIVRENYTYLVKAVPQPVSELNFTKFFGELLADERDENELTLASLLKEKLCQQACKGAIKGGDVLTRAQIAQVIKNYVDENGNLPTNCPHGRPAVIALDKRDLGKMFRRII